VRVSILLAAVVAGAGCASAPKSSFSVVGNGDMRTLRQSTSWSADVVPGKGLAHFTAAEQAAMMSGMMFGAIGGAVGAIAATSSANRRGGELAEDRGLVDPSLLVAEKLLQRLNAGSQTSDEAKARLTLTTSHWQLGQGNVAYFVQLQAYAAGNGNVVAKGECKYSRKLGEAGTSEQQLLDGSAEGLKSEYGIAAEHCADYFMEQLIPGSSP
jgi:hypothetical protein